MSRHPLPDAALKGHIAVVGMTGGGKTFTTKGIVEHILERDPAARVCVLDPIKSDWWGVTSSADGKHPGLPFHILGGPRGHVPLHETAGKAIGELVGSGALPLSIIDMADFGPGGLQTFFNDFAPALLRRIRGVVYLVLEEAHEFAPKERAGFGGETMTVHFAKKLATAGRSKGVRIIAATQRTQQLHNSVLGSCQTVIAHQLTYPADIEPVAKWFKGHVDKATFARFSETLTSLPTGTGWLCSGQAKVAEMVQFPRIWTFDNSATPDGADEIDVKTAPVDLDKLRAIVGDAVAEAEANDPATLRAEVARLKAELGKKAAGASAASSEQLDAAYQRGREDGAKDGHERLRQAATAARIADGRLSNIAAVVEEARDDVRAVVVALESATAAPTPGITHAREPFTPATGATGERFYREAAPRPDLAKSGQSKPDSAGSGLGKGDRLVLTVLAQYAPARVSASKAAAIAGYSVRSSTWRNILSRLRQAGLIEPGPEPFAITPEGRTVLGPFEPLPTGAALLEHWMARVGKGDRETLRILATLRGECPSSDLAQRAGYSPSSSTWRNILSRLRTLGLIEGSRNIKLHEDLR